MKDTVILQEWDGKTVAAVLRLIIPDLTWNQARRLVEKRYVRIDDHLCLDSSRRLKVGQLIKIADQPETVAPTRHQLVLPYVDGQIVVVEKPAGINTVRHPSEREWSSKRRANSPSLDELVQKKLGQSQRLRVVHRLDKETSGLLVFARTVNAERHLGKQFHAHSVHRLYNALVHGKCPAQTITSQLIRDRGDGRRGSSEGTNQGKPATTHVEVLEKFSDYTLLSCRLETGRTHQIRIHLSEAGFPVCGEMVYNRHRNGAVMNLPGRFARLMLHAAELGFLHPFTQEPIHLTMEWPVDFANQISLLRDSFEVKS